MKKDIKFTKFEDDLIIEINKKLGCGCGMLYMILLMHKNKNEGKADSCFPSFKLLSEETKLTKNTICKYVKDLKDNGYLIVKSGKFDTKNTQNESNRYYFPKSDISVTCYSEDEYYNLFKDLIETKRELDECPFTSYDTPF